MSGVHCAHRTGFSQLMSVKVFRRNPRDNQTMKPSRKDARRPIAARLARILTLRLVLALTVLVPLAFGTNIAAAREDARTMKCSAAQVLVRKNGKVLLTTGTHTFDLFVAGRRYCIAGEKTVPALTETLDRKRCRVGYHCVATDEYDDN